MKGVRDVSSVLLARNCNVRSSEFSRGSDGELRSPWPFGVPLQTIPALRGREGTNSVNFLGKILSYEFL